MSTDPSLYAEGAPILDLTILCAQTGGNDNLEREVLGLFRNRCADELARLKAAREPDARRAAAHGLVGSARAVGAVGVARLAASVERGNLTVLPALEAAVDEVRRYIDTYLAA
jgi:HPt (histidine-containing phosphotransfer) domain-containing protein